MKKIILITTVVLLSFSYTQAQRKGAFRAGLDIAIIPATKGFGLGFTLEPKYNIKQNMSVGLRFGSSGIVKDIKQTSNTNSGTVSTHSYVYGTYDYYFSSGTSFVPFVGGGLGYSSNSNVMVVDLNNNNSSNTKSQGGFSGLVRAGFEAGKFRLGVEYNILPESLLLNEATGIYTGNTSNSYLGINVGFYVGGGKWKKSKTK
jgi:hypothetical protein